MAGINHRLGDTLQFDVDLTTAKLEGTPASGGVANTPSTDVEYYLNLRLSGQNLRQPGDAATIGVRLGQNDSTNSAGFYVNARLPRGNGWHLLPRLHLEWRDYRYQDQIQYVIGPALRAEYRWRQHWHFELDGGLDWSRTEIWLGNRDELYKFITLGYRLDF